MVRAMYHQARPPTLQRGPLPSHGRLGGTPRWRSVFEPFGGRRWGFGLGLGQGQRCTPAQTHEAAKAAAHEAPEPSPATPAALPLRSWGDDLLELRWDGPCLAAVPEASLPSPSGEGSRQGRRSKGQGQRQGLRQRQGRESSRAGRGESQEEGQGAWQGQGLTLVKVCGGWPSWGRGHPYRAPPRPSPLIIRRSTH